MMFQSTRESNPPAENLECQSFPLRMWLNQQIRVWEYEIQQPPITQVVILPKRGMNLGEKGSRAHRLRMDPSQGVMRRSGG